jgi:hypothetical protein
LSFVLANSKNPHPLPMTDTFHSPLRIRLMMVFALSFVSKPDVVYAAINQKVGAGGGTALRARFCRETIARNRQ